MRDIRDDRVEQAGMPAVGRSKKTTTVLSSAFLGPKDLGWVDFPKEKRFFLYRMSVVVPILCGSDVGGLT
jgi:hypothetical protein